LLELLAVKLVQVTGTNIAVAGSVILWMSAALSAILDNVPFVATKSADQERGAGLWRAGLCRTRVG
jgi:Na+/H+ antiporter NhaD/arsenite permease-like protein